MKDILQGKKTLKHKKYIFIFLMLIIFAILLYICINIGKLGTVSANPILNIDVFNIEANVKCKNCVVKDPDTPVYNPGDDPGTDPKPEPEEDLLTVNDKYIFWEQNTRLSIFSNSDFDSKSIIAPGQKGEYQFIINNNTTMNIEYDLRFSENNIYNFPLKYKIKLNGSYINNTEHNWVKYNDLDVLAITLPFQTKSVYTLEWIWEEGSNDNVFGTNTKFIYELGIKIYAKQI